MNEAAQARAILSDLIEVRDLIDSAYDDLLDRSYADLPLQQRKDIANLLLARARVIVSILDPWEDPFAGDEGDDG
jgi:hypothetical protein